jgi:hypothetical protein
MTVSLTGVDIGRENLSMFKFNYRPIAINFLHYATRERRMPGMNFLEYPSIGSRHTWNDVHFSSYEVSL